MSNKVNRRRGRRASRQRGAALDHGILPDLLGYQLRLAQLAAFRDFEEHVGALGVSPGRVGVLALIEANPGVTQSELARAVGLDRSTMVPLLDRFEKRGVVERHRGADRRTNGLWVTQSGKRLLSEIERRIAAHEERIAAALSRGERAQLMALLRKLQPSS